jgi:hypothetical protein
MSMSQYTDILADLETATAEYRKSAATADPAELRQMMEGIKGLRRELSDAASEGARACPGCKRPPHGMRRTEATLRSSEVWEIGCLTCPPRDGVRFCARGFSREQAVVAWNAGEFVKV